MRLGVCLRATPRYPEGPLLTTGASLRPSTLRGVRLRMARSSPVSPSARFRRRTSQPAIAEFSPSASLGPCRRRCRHCPTLSGCAPAPPNAHAFESRTLDASALPCGRIGRDVQRNKLSGTVPASFSTLRKLTSLCATRTHAPVSRILSTRGWWIRAHASETAPASVDSQCRHE